MIAEAAVLQAEGLFQHNKPRYYEARYDGQAYRLTSVTSALRALNKPLVPWAVKLTATAAVNHLDKLVENVGAFGREPTIELLRGLADQQRDTAAGRGTDIHALCAAIVRGEAVHETEEQRPYLDGFRQFLVSRMPRVVASEEMVANLTHGYGGTFDLILNLDGELWMVDIKTAEDGKGPYPETGLQLAAYKAAEFIGKPNDPKRYPMPRPIRRFAVLSLRPGGHEWVPYAVTRDTWESFLAALRVSRWINGEAKTIIRRTP